MIHYFYGTLQGGIGQTLCSFEHVSCKNNKICIKDLEFANISCAQVTVNS